MLRCCCDVSFIFVLCIRLRRLATITAGNYRTSAEESLDQRLDAARQTRDKLGAVAEQWRIAGNLLRTAAMEANRGSELWSLVPLSK